MPGSVLVTEERTMIKTDTISDLMKVNSIWKKIALARDSNYLYNFSYTLITLPSRLEDVNK